MEPVELIVEDLNMMYLIVEALKVKKLNMEDELNVEELSLQLK